MRIAFLGLGLIGGSVARALRAGDEARSGPFHGAALVAWSPSGAGPRAAAAAGVVNAAADSAEAAVAGADLVILAAPPLEVLGLLDDLAGRLRSSLAPGALLTDVASTKGAIVARAAERGLRFVGGHPMAGRETTGFGAASADLLHDRPWAVVPDGAAAADVETVEALARACGARPLRLSAAAHDAATAAVSHLPLVVAAALVEAVVGPPPGPARPDWPAAAQLAATGWRDMTRLARGDVAMSAGILATNGQFIAAELRALRAAIDGWLAELDRDGGPEAGRLAARFAAARDRLERGS
jgi:prephenate dehydrogenase